MNKIIFIMLLINFVVLAEPELVLVDHTNMHSYLNLAQAYESEFSSLAKKLPNQQGLFPLDTLPGKEYIGYLLYLDMVPIGFCVADIDSEIHDIAEFYIIPVVRKKGYGKFLAFEVFNRYPGLWHVRQIENADKAIAFWRKIINEYTNSNFTEAIINDSYWGFVTRQEFCNKK